MVSLNTLCEKGLNISASLLLLVHALLKEEEDREDGGRWQKVMDHTSSQI